MMKRGVDYIGVGCGCLIINESGQILLIKRTDKTQGGDAGLWSRPGGAVEFGESLEVAVKREIKEELNVDVELFGPRLYMDDLKEENGVLRHRFTGGGFGRIVGGELKNMEPEKHSEIKWFNLDTLPENINEYTKQAIEDYKERLKGN